MSDAAMTWARSVRVGKSGAKLVLLVLADRASPAGIVSDCTQRDIAEEAELTDRQVRQLLSYLEHDAEIIDRERRAGDGHGRQNDIITLAMSKRPVILGRKRRQPEEFSASGNRKKLPAGQPEICDRQPEIFDRKILPVGATGNLPHTPSKNITLTLSKGLANANPKGSPKNLHFEALLALWRTKDTIRRTRRKPAFETYSRLMRDGVSPDRIELGARAYLAAANNTRDGGQYMPELFRWLRDHAWDDWAEGAEAEADRRQRIHAEHGYWNADWGPEPANEPRRHIAGAAS